ncbi:MAG: vitamin B12 dependent-methionine synthase activation domain-containing protein [Segetibacter sp.]
MKILLKKNIRVFALHRDYPACPDHTEKYKLFALLDATNATGIQLNRKSCYVSCFICVRLVFCPS